MKKIFVLAIAFAAIGLVLIGCKGMKASNSSSNSESNSAVAVSETKPVDNSNSENSSTAAVSESKPSGGNDSELILPAGEGWVRELANDFLGVYIFNADNTYESFMLLEGELDPNAPNVNGTYTISENKITMTPDGLSSGTTFTYAVNGNSATFGSYTYTRQTFSK